MAEIEVDAELAEQVEKVARRRGETACDVVMRSLKAFVGRSKTRPCPECGADMPALQSECSAECQQSGSF